jgi:D-3-phosphoglycerate dehydrogenase
MATHRVLFMARGRAPRQVIVPELEPVGAELLEATASNEDEIIAACRGMDGVIIHGRALMTPRVMAELDRCRVIAKTGVGVDKIDVAAATDHGILVCNAPGGNTTEVADQTIGLILAITRKLFKTYDFVRSGAWGQKGAGTPHGARGPTHRLAGRTLGIFGLGRIGRAVAQRARGFELHLLGHDPYVAPEQADSFGVELVDKDELFRRSHIVTLHAPLTPETHRAVGARELALMPAGSYLVNAARGGLLDYAALTDALRSGHLDGAGLDVTDPEPLPPESPLLHMDNVIVTAHTAANSEESYLDVCAHAAACVAAVLRGEMPSTPVNPEAVARRVAG